MNNKKIILITGGTDGIGKATAKGIAQTRATVIISGRNSQKAEKAVREIKTSSNNPNIEVVIADLSSIKGINYLVSEVKSKYNSLDVLINNIGYLSTKKETTADGFEKIFFLNYLLPFYLTNAMIPLLQNADGSRIINLGGGIYKTGKINLNSLVYTKKKFNRLTSIAMAKLALVQYSIELSRRLQDSHISVFVSDPGAARSGMGTKNHAWAWYFRVLMSFMATSTEKAAKSTVYAAISPDLTGKTGLYINAKCKSVAPSKKALDKSMAKQLWEKSESLLNIRYS